VADARGTPLRLGIVLALGIVALFEVQSLLQGVRSMRRLRARVTHEVEREVQAVRPRLDAVLRPGDRASWDAAARLALADDVAAEVEVLSPDGRRLFSRPTVAPVTHAIGADERRRVVEGQVFTTVVQQGPVVRVLSYLPLAGARPGTVLRLATAAPDLEQELGERQRLLLGHLAAIGALAVAVVLVLLWRPSPERPAAPAGALAAYEAAMERLRDHGEEVAARHEAERRQMEDSFREMEALARAGELTAGIVHEVRNGLGTISGYARMLERSAAGADAAAAGQAIRQECETLETVVRRFSDFIRVETLNLVPTDLGRLLERVVVREERERVRMRLLGAEPPVVLPADEEMLERAFENLVRNAVEAARAGGGHVSVEVQRSPGSVEVRVEDDGPGLAPDHPGEIRPFYSTRAGGLGLGLPLARKIVLLHGGSLRLEASESGGVQVLVVLPDGESGA
jgi:signal transduction histidine kinase